MVELEEGIPTPERPMREVWEKMKNMAVGNSMLIPNKYRNQIFPRARLYGFKITSMMIDDLNTRIWRIEG